MYLQWLLIFLVLGACFCMESYCLNTLAVKHKSHLCAAFSTRFLSLLNHFRRTQNPAYTRHEELSFRLHCKCFLNCVFWFYKRKEFQNEDLLVSRKSSAQQPPWVFQWETSWTVRHVVDKTALSWDWTEWVFKKCSASRVPKAFDHGPLLVFSSLSVFCAAE